MFLSRYRPRPIWPLVYTYSHSTAGPLHLFRLFLFGLSCLVTWYQSRTGVRVRRPPVRPPPRPSRAARRTRAGVFRTRAARHGPVLARRAQPVARAARRGPGSSARAPPVAAPSRPRPSSSRPCARPSRPRPSRPRPSSPCARPSRPRPSRPRPSSSRGFRRSPHRCRFVTTGASPSSAPGLLSFHSD
jgi:hypothetical protein